MNCHGKYQGRMGMKKKPPYSVNAIREGSWSDFRQAVKNVNVELFQIIEQISPSKKFKLYEVTYGYGEKITDLGTVCLPDSTGELFKLNAPELPDSYREQLGYCPTPLILQLTNGSEVFVDTQERIIPLNIFTPGDLYGLFESIIGLNSLSYFPLLECNCWCPIGFFRC
jgi:hypothetical protein